MSSSLILICFTDMKFDHVGSLFRKQEKKDKKQQFTDRQEERASKMYSIGILCLLNGFLLIVQLHLKNIHVIHMADKTQAM